jgi:hypothetical protein
LDSITRRRALRAAAKVALALSVQACAVDPAPDEVEASADLRHGGRAKGQEPCDGGTDNATCRTVKAGETNVTAKDIACCKTFFDKNTVNKDSFFPGPTLAPGASTEQAASCCNAVSIYAEQNPTATDAAELAATLRFGVCCKFDSDPLACTPWGPPTPPAMRANFKLLEPTDVAQVS